MFKILSILIISTLNFNYGIEGAPGILIVGGTPATPGEFPHQVSLRMYGNHFCGGTILNANTMLTAAHCVYGLSLLDLVGLQAVVGSNFLNSGGTSFGLNFSIIHPQYDPITMLNDIAVIKIIGTIQFNSFVQPIGLATSALAPGTSTVVSGWGLTSYPVGSNSNALQYLVQQSIDLQTCAQSLQGANPIGTGHVCTSSPLGQGACGGDSGGPLVANGVQVGVASWDVGCAGGFPGVSTSVASYNTWISSVI